MEYAWGSSDLLADLLGIETPNHPIAEVWFGTHKTSPAKVLDAENGTLLERQGELSYLVKFLSAASPLSIQAHPTKDRAFRQFSKTNPSYSDANHKPEILIALTPFRALCGFRPKTETLTDLQALSQASPQLTPLLEEFQAAGYQAAMNWIYQADDSSVLALVANATSLGRSRARLVESLHEAYPLDRGILVSVLMNLVTLSPGEAIYLPAGNIHAYLEGLGVEAMAASDNVLRGGLTSKRIDVKELLQVLDYSELREPRVKVKKITSAITQYPIGVDDFEVYGLSVSPSSLIIDVKFENTAILVCTSGYLEVSTSKDEMLRLKKGEAAFISDARLFSCGGSGDGFLVTGS